MNVFVGWLVVQAIDYIQPERHYNGDDEIDNDMDEYFYDNMKTSTNKQKGQGE